MDLVYYIGQLVYPVGGGGEIWVNERYPYINQQRVSRY